MKKTILSTFALALLVCSCSNDDDMTPTVPLGDYENGIIIVGEGGFTTSGTISFVSDDLMTSENDVFFNINAEELGSFFQSIGFNDNLAYMVVDNGTITVANRYTMEKTGAITAGLASPRYMAFSNGKGFVSNWGDPNITTDDFIAVINLFSNTVETTIPVDFGPEQLVINGNKLFVSHKGAFGINNIVSVIDTNNNSVETIALDDKPDEMIINNAGNLIVLSEGATLYDIDFNVIGNTDASINTINVTDHTVISTLSFEAGQHPSLMSYENGVLYYVLDNKVYSLTDTDTALPSNAILNLTAGFAYGMAVKNNNLFISDASFSQQSTLQVYDLNALSLTESFTVALAASKIYFN
ncbi:MAG: cell surface protein [Winogradskyella sp.]|nr:cell surface protein [Winogradskyella sp.]